MFLFESFLSGKSCSFPEDLTFLRALSVVKGGMVRMYGAGGTESVGFVGFGHSIKVFWYVACKEFMSSVSAFQAYFPTRAKLG